MQPRTALTLILFATVTSVAWWLWPRDPSRDVRAALKDGENKVALVADPVQACAGYSNNMLTFCIEGYFYQAAQNDQADKQKSLIQIAQGEIERFQLTQSPWKLVWAVAFGLALIKTERDIVELRGGVPPLIFNYIVDGWALEASGKWGAPEALRLCQAKLSQELWATCAWGIGRGHFFYPENQADLDNTFTQAGYAFARNFTQPGIPPENAVLEEKHPGAKMAHLAKRLYAGFPVNEGDLQRRGLCLGYRHVTECL